MLSPAYGKCEKWTALFFFFLRCEPGTDAEPSLQKMWKVDRTFLFFCGVNLELMLSPAYKKCEKWTALFFFCGVNLEQMLSPAYRKCEKWTALFFFFAVWTWNWCWAQLTENVEGRPHFSFFLRCEPGTDAEPSLQKMWKVDRSFLFLQCEPGTDAEPSLQKMWKVDRSFLFLRCEPGTDAEPSLQKMWKVDRTFLFCGVNLELMLSPAYRKCEKWTALFFFAVWTWNRCWAQLTENVKSGPHFSFFFCGVNLEQMLSPAYRKCEKWTAVFFFCGVNLELMLSPAYRTCGRSTALFFFFAVWTWNRCWAQLTENVKSGPHFSFFLRCEPGTDAEPSLEKMWKVDRTFLFFLRCEPGTDAEPSLQNMWKVDRTFLFFCGVNLELMLSPAYRKCGRWTALFFFFAVWTWNRCWAQLTENVKSGPHFSFFLRCEPGTDAEPSLQKMWKVDRTFLFFCSVNLEQMLSPAYRKCEKWTAVFFFCGVNLEQMLSPAYRKCEKWTWNRCWPSWQKLWREREIGTADFSQSMRMRVSLAFFFALFHIFFPFFTLFSFFFTFFPFLFSHSFSHFRWPGRGRSLAALPCPHITSPLLSFLNSLKKKEHRYFQQISVLRSSCPPKRLIISRSIHMSSCRRWIQIVIPNVSCLWDVCVVKARS